MNTMYSIRIKKPEKYKRPFKIWRNIMRNWWREQKSCINLFGLESRKVRGFFFFCWPEIIMLLAFGGLKIKKVTKIWTHGGSLVVVCAVNVLGLFFRIVESPHGLSACAFGNQVPLWILFSCWFYAFVLCLHVGNRISKSKKKVAGVDECLEWEHSLPSFVLLGALFSSTRAVKG